MRTRKAYLAINRLIATLENAERQLYDIRGMIKQLPKDWYVHASDCGYSDAFLVLLEMQFTPAALSGLNLIDFIRFCKSLKDYQGGPLLD